MKKIISVGGAGTQRSLDNALGHPEAFVRSAVVLIHAFGLAAADFAIDQAACSLVLRAVISDQIPDENVCIDAKHQRDRSSVGNVFLPFL